MLGHAKIHNGIVRLRAGVIIEVLAHDAARQSLLVDQPLNELLRLRRDGQRSHLHATAACVLDERSPSSSDVEHTLARLYPAALESIFQLTFLCCIEWFI